MFCRLVCWLCILFVHVVCQPDTLYEDTSLVSVPVIIFNAFPQDDITAFIIFEEARVNRIPYGEYAHEDILLQANDNFLFEYRKRLTEGILIEIRYFVLRIASSEAVLDFIGYGFIGSTVDKGSEVLIVLSQISLEANTPFADPIMFDTNFEAGFSKLYIYNAVTTTRNQGMVYYYRYI